MSTSSTNNGERVDSHRRRGARYRARRRAVDILFEAESRDLDPVAVVAERVELASPSGPVAPVAEYTQAIIAGAATEIDLLDQSIERYLSETWELDRLPAVDRAILRVAAWEILFNPEVPRAVAVTEGVELASEYAADSSPAYIHSVLDDIGQHREELLLTNAPDAEEVEPASQEASD